MYRRYLAPVLLLCNAWTGVHGAPPEAPILERDICPFEYGCDFLYWVVGEHLVAFVQRGDTANVAFHVEPGDTLTFLHGDMVIGPGCSACEKIDRGIL